MSSKVEKLERVNKLLGLAYEMLREDGQQFLAEDVLGCIDSINEEIMEYELVDN
jgi:hypothetical protein